VPVGDAPLFRNRSGAPYSKDTPGDDFRAVRTMVFGKNDDRQLADIRRSGAVEATVGGAKVVKQAKKMANTISASTRLQKVYNPVDVESVRSGDRSREQARRERKERTNRRPAVATHTRRRARHVRHQHSGLVVRGRSRRPSNACGRPGHAKFVLQFPHGDRRRKG
jgi:hypothetical protein